MAAWEHHRHKTKIVELGEEPPIAMGEQDPSRYTRRGVSLRWLFGAVVTAVTSVALMGGALVAALDGRYVLQAQAAVIDAVAQPRAPKAQKGDRIQATMEAVSSRKIIEVSTVVRQGVEDHIAKRPYALINASLVLDDDAIGDVPKFNAGEIAAKQTPTASTTDAIYDKKVDGEITVSVSAFPLDGQVAFDQTAEEVEQAEVEPALRDEQYSDNIVSSRGEVEAFTDPSTQRAPNITVVPENVSELIKSSDDDADGSSDNELIELVQPGDTLSKILRGSGVNGDDIKAIDTILGRLGVATLKPGQTLRIGFELDEDGEDAQRRPNRFTIYAKDEHVATVALTDEGRFVLGEAPPGPAPVVEDVQIPTSRGGLPSIYRSLYQTAVDHNLPNEVRDVLLKIFSADVDFNASVRPGDKLTVLHAADTTDGRPPEILFASLTAAGVERRFYRFKSSDGVIDYYDEDGRTGDKFLMRKPMQRGIFRSGFGMRRHPILHRSRMHTGVDYAAPRGTPIYAAGDGVVQQAGWKAGYGRWTLIRHKNGYATGYGHQSRIAKGIKPGVQVKQGQVIGYVGSTGFSTGPHLHYEVHVNGRPVNPLKIRLRRGRELSGTMLSNFKSERDRIDALLAQQNVELARR
ncbi:M23 family metallopeptidase [Acuticoccus mangrovi]|uniref:LysM peptidoglycan-binding domain-containing M23 family metallopeptidase n=1 Tax=Acuticoccus mangrovi TaxID=2796142 RepID=A0A934IL30_9HYPH|nr:LysM peptidoglycan-binding domain-containing M23 family metallopeptidase [Acuticoccus mangrovi]